MHPQKALIDFAHVKQTEIAPLATKIIDLMTTNVALFKTPPIPLDVVGLQVIAVRNILAKSEYAGRASDLKAAIISLEGSLRRNGIYVNLTAKGDKGTLEKSGYPISKERTPVGKLLAPDFLRVSKGTDKGSFNVDIAVVKNATGYLFSYTPSENTETDPALWGTKYSSNHKNTFGGFELGKKYKFAACGVGGNSDSLTWKISEEVLFAQ